MSAPLEIDQPRKVSIVVGPSHAIRWNWHIRDGVVAADLPFDCVLGIGGAPSWSRRLFETAKGALAEGGAVGVIVGDFRFGNHIERSADGDTSQQFHDGFLGIDAEAMTQDIDQRMQARGMSAIKAWHNAFGDKVRLIFWDLFGCQVLDRLAGRHINEGRYRHPVFNYAETVAEFPYAQIVNLAPLLRRPMHEVQRLFIDASCHPSQVGYLFLNETLIKGRNVLEAYDDAVLTVESELMAYARRIAKAKGRPLLLTGRSVWLDTLVAHLGKDSALRLAQEGLLIAPLDRAPGQPGINQLVQDTPLDRYALTVMAPRGEDLTPQLARTFGTNSRFWRDVPCIDWESATKPAITARGETPRFRHGGGVGPRAAACMTPEIAAHMVEQGPLGMPSWSGLRHLLDWLASDAIPTHRGTIETADEVTAKPSVQKVEGDALLTTAGFAFLIGGNEPLLKYATGELRPSERSVANFGANIASRRAMAASVGARYAHVVFPDKQSVLTEDFPYQPVHRLGDIYLDRLAAPERSSVLFPVEALRRETKPTFLKLDTHLTDHGSLVVLRLILAALGIEADATLDHIASRITRQQRWSGDLGSKFTPRLFQEGTLLDPDWAMTELRSPGGFNDGMIDLLFNPKAAVDKTLLVFGDSFYRLTLKSMSAVFGKVIHLRSRFLHPEMVTLIAPDFILTGNAERYLSDVAPDSDAHAFALYPELRGTPPPREDASFLEGWRAVTAPKASSSHRYFRELGFKAECEAQPPVKLSSELAAASCDPAGLKVLIATHHLFRFGGSELVALELAEELRSRGCVVSIFSPFADAIFLKSQISQDIEILTDPTQVDISKYDVAYSHHQTLSQVLAQQKGVFPFEGPVPFFIYNHLSPFEQMEFPGPFVEAQTADLILCNSDETRSRLALFGSEFAGAVLLPNPAPAIFEASTRANPRSQLKRLLSVSSHLPKELEAAFSILESMDIAVTRIGLPAHERRLTPKDLEECDAVVTIGKTVQYALRSRRPVYCYDHFGGPGWLVEENFDEAARTNFSGRSKPQRGDPEIVARELVADYAHASEFSNTMSSAVVDPFRLEICIDELLRRILPVLGRPHRLQKQSAAKQAELRRQWDHESELYKLFDRHFHARLSWK